MMCISCKHIHDGNYCPNCGEPSDTKKITFKSILENALSTLTNMDRGFLYNVKMLTINPRTFIESYLAGKRKGILNPISYLILAATVYLIIEVLLREPVNKVIADQLSRTYLQQLANATGQYTHKFFKYYWILSIIPLSICTRILLQQYNYIEHLAINSFIVGYATLVGLIVYVVFQIDLVFNPLVYLSILWLLYRFYSTGSDRFELGVLTVLSVGAFVIFLLLIAVAIGFFMVEYILV